jgi:hypothetical protein
MATAAAVARRGRAAAPMRVDADAGFLRGVLIAGQPSTALRIVLVFIWI